MQVMNRAFTLVAVLCICAAGCDQKDPETPDPGDPPSGVVRVMPGARISWRQGAADAAEAASLQFALYIDGSRTTLAGATCSGSGGDAGFECSAVLPSLSTGTHTLEIAAFSMDGSATLESPRSAPLQVVAGGTAAGFSTPSRFVFTAEKVQLNLAPVAENLRLPSDLAFAPDGSIFVAERGGVVRLIRDGALVETPALDVSREITRPEGGLLAIALDLKFGENGLMYALYAVDAPRNGLEFTLARFRFVDGIFAERAVLLDRTKASDTGASGALRIGSDGKLYVALDSASDTRIASSFATYNGKVLRMNTDATTPGDQPDSNPIFSLAHPQPLALDWQPASGTMWVVDRFGADAGRLSAVAKAAGQPRAAFHTSYALPEGTGATSAAFYRGDLTPIFKGDLFIAAEAARQLIRLRFDPENSSKIVTVERMLQDEIGAVRVVAEGPDGGLYIATESVLYRLAP
jgi:glucose/arabinose dehydrogenase